MNQLYVVPTPIGNLSDMTFRAIEVLKSVSLILAEDTRQTRKLMDHYGITTPVQSHHAFNEHRTVDPICDKIIAGQDVALVSDAGTPAISDPGFLLVRTCITRGIKVETLPGPTAFVPALVNSGIPCDRFCFEGFLPPKKGRNKKLLSLADETRTMIFYESPFRLVKTLEEFSNIFGADRNVSVSRELSKLYEENIRGTLSEVAAYYSNKAPRGEIVIVLAGKKE